MANLRQRHESLQQKHYGDLIPDNEDVSYLFHTPSGDGYPEEGQRAVAVHINSPGDDFWMMVNMTSEAIDFRVQAAEEGNVWRRLIDTASWAEPASNHWPEGDGMIVRDVATVQPWSIVVWHQLERPDGSRPVPVWQD